jgi:hypothetical protein
VLAQSTLSNEATRRFFAPTLTSTLNYSQSEYSKGPGPVTYCEKNMSPYSKAGKSLARFAGPAPSLSRSNNSVKGLISLANPNPHCIEERPRHRFNLYYAIFRFFDFDFDN